MFPEKLGPKLFIYWLAVFAEACSFIGMSLIIILTTRHFGGMGMDNADTMINLHAFLMPLSIFICGNAIITYRVLTPQNPEKSVFRSYECIRFIHMFLQFATLVLISFGLYCAFQSRHIGGRFHLYSMHSWLGIILISLFVCQFVAGAGVNICRIVEYEKRQSFIGVHSVVGLITLILGCIVALLGIDQKAKFTIYQYPWKPPQAYMVNFFGICLVAFVALVLFIVINPSFEFESDYVDTKKRPVSRDQNQYPQKRQRPSRQGVSASR